MSPTLVAVRVVPRYGRESVTGFRGRTPHAFHKDTTHADDRATQQKREVSGRWARWAEAPREVTSAGCIRSFPVVEKGEAGATLPDYRACVAETVTGGLRN